MTCQTCGGLGCTCTRYCEKATDHPCPDCVDDSIISTNGYRYRVVDLDATSSPTT